MNAKSWASVSKNEELIGHLESLSAVLTALRLRERRSELPPWLGRELREAEAHLVSAQIALRALQPRCD